MGERLDERHETGVRVAHQRRHGEDRDRLADRGDDGHAARRQRDGGQQAGEGRHVEAGAVTSRRAMHPYKLRSPSWTTAGIDGAAAANPDLVTFGSGPNEGTTGGSAIAKPWNASWKGKTTITASSARAAPSGTTGWVVASVELQKKGYKILIVFCVFDKNASGEWTLVHMHLAV